MSILRADEVATVREKAREWSYPADELETVCESHEMLRADRDALAGELALAWGCSVERVLELVHGSGEEPECIGCDRTYHTECPVHGEYARWLDAGGRGAFPGSGEDPGA